MSVAFYISGHGFGHASRQIEIINAFARRRPDVPIFIRSAAARRLFDRTVKSPFELDDRPCDTGVVQFDSLHLDAAATIAAAAEFHQTVDGRADSEARLLAARRVSFVVSDAPPLGCLAAARANIRSVVISNFTWDWIYAEYREHLSTAPDLIRTIQDAYRQAEAAWRLPMHGGFETFARIEDMPFVARHARHTRVETRERLGLPADRRLALSSFGGYGFDGIDYARRDTGSSWAIVTTRNRGEDVPPEGVYSVDETLLYAAGLRYEDLVAACDVVVTKPGYGIISECIANDVPVVYTSRGRFAEYDVLVREMPRYLRCANLDQQSLKTGQWRDALDTSLDSAKPPERPPTNGADMIADLLTAKCG